MQKRTKRRIMQNRRRFNLRKIINIRNICIFIALVICVSISSSVISANMLKNKVAKSTVKFSEKKQNEEVALLDDENLDNNVEQNDKTNVDESVDLNINLDDNTSNSGEKNSVTLNILGEIMMGGEVSTNLNYSYSNAIRSIYSTTRLADFTYANFSTNITNLDNTQNAKSKYIVTSNVLNALSALGLDSVSIASDHITDFEKDIIENTQNKLEEKEIFVAGRKDMPVYFEKGDKKIAIVSSNAVIIGTEKNYSNVGISVYSQDNMKKNIKDAKQNADVVIADIHWGRDHTYGVTDQMRDIAKACVDAGADMVIGSHALGVYPVVRYNNVPIIYSTGYFISDSDYNVAKTSFIFKITISEDGKISSLEMTPTYVKDKSEVLLYTDYDREKCQEYLEQFNTWHIDNELDSKIVNDKIVISF